MSEYLIQGASLVSIADAIRGKTGDTAALTPAQMAAAIAALVIGSGGSGSTGGGSTGGGNTGSGGTGTVTPGAGGSGSTDGAGDGSGVQCPPLIVVGFVSRVRNWSGPAVDDVDIYPGTFEVTT